MKKIFVVEDDESICKELVQILENEGYEAESLKNFDNTKDDILKGADENPETGDNNDEEIMDFNTVAGISHTILTNNGDLWRVD